MIAKRFYTMYVLLGTVFDRNDLIALFTSFYELKMKNKPFEHGSNEIQWCPVSSVLFFPGITLLYARTYYLPKYFEKIMWCILFVLFYLSSNRYADSLDIIIIIDHRRIINKPRRTLIYYYRQRYCHTTIMTHYNNIYNIIYYIRIVRRVQNVSLGAWKQNKIQKIRCT